MGWDARIIFMMLKLGSASIPALHRIYWGWRNKSKVPLRKFQRAWVVLGFTQTQVGLPIQQHLAKQSL
jgi:hypothetical protein